MADVADFGNAHRRHWSDAELLFKHHRWANADQLYGFSAECGLKEVMEFLGMKVRNDGTPSDRKYRQHIKKLWPEFQSFIGENKSVNYAKLLQTSNPFADWSHNDRYANGDRFSDNCIQHHRDAARDVLTMVQRVILEGRR